MRQILEPMSSSGAGSGVEEMQEFQAVWLGPLWSSTCPCRSRSEHSTTMEYAELSRVYGKGRTTLVLQESQEKVAEAQGSRRPLRSAASVTERRKFPCLETEVRQIFSAHF